MAKFCPLFSSSSGNCIYIGTSDGGILIDAGVSAKRITGALENIGVSPDSISAIFITHEHSDHINGLRVFAGSRNIDVYASAGTLRALDSMSILNGKFTAREISENGAEAAGIYVKPFATPHDAAQSCGYTVVTPDGCAFEGQAERIVCRAIDGDIAILAKHGDYCTALGMGEAHIVDADGQRRRAACMGGLLSVLDGDVRLVATTWEWAEDIDQARAEASKKRAEEILARKNLNDREYELAQARLKRALVRTSVR